MKVTSEDLKEGEVLCPECEGSGSHPKDLEKESMYFNRCMRCLGEGKLDWVEAAMQKREPAIILPKLRTTWPKLLAKDLLSVQPMDKPELVNIFFKRRTRWQKAVTYLRDSKPWQRLLTIFSKGKEEDGTITSQENTSPPF